MRLLFVENRQKTWFWDAIAGTLSRRGHEIRWVQQSPAFQGSTGRSHRIPPPRGAEANGAADAWFDEIRASDRYCRNFGGTPGHYSYYRERLAGILDSLQPDALIGEATLFHELILIKLCRERGIEYLNPTGARHPDGRFFVLHYDTQRVAAESGELLPEAEAQRIADAIAQRALAPYYMRRPDRLRAARKQASLRLGHARILAAWVGGERFNTPSPWRRVSMGWQLRRRLRRWDELARPLAPGEKAILYALQMQPENNIDVWGRGFNDQTELIGALLRHASREVAVAVKGNPKAKYELSEELLSLAARDRRVVLLPRETSMADAQRDTLGSVTVTGTVGLEAVFGAARCFSLAHPLITDEFPTFAARDPAHAVERVLGSPELGRGNAALGARLIQRFTQQSFAGSISDPTSHPEVMREENVLAVTRGLERALSACFSRSGKPAPVAVAERQ
jgi:hypothetical protein